MRRFGQRGNAILISLIIMASTLTISLGIAALVSAEIKTTGLLVPSERAYYKAESFVEQALWNKTKGSTTQAYGPNYQAPSRDQSDGNGRPAVKDQAYVCTTAPCFERDPRGTDALLKRFSATTQPPSDVITLSQDEPQQLEVGDPDANERPIFEISDAQATAVPGGVINQNPAANYQGLEVTIIAIPKASNCGNFRGLTTAQSVGPTCTYVDKQRIGRTETTKTFNLNTTNRLNAVGEAAPQMKQYTYRLRVKALGADGSARVRARLSSGTQLTLRTPDFTASAVAEDTRAQRGVQVVVPDVPEVLSIFDYVLFADADLEKLGAKKPDGADSQGINVTVYNDINCDGIQQGGENGLEGIGVNLAGGPSDPRSADTGASGTTNFSSLYAGNYTVSLGTLPGTYASCGPTSQNVTVPNNGQAVGTTLRVRTKRVPLHQYWSAALGNHYYTINYFDPATSGNFISASYSYEGIAGYVYKDAVPNTTALYEFYYGLQNNLLHDSYYSTDPTNPGAGWSTIGTVGYLAPYTGPNPYNANPNQYNGSCPNIAGQSVPWYRMLNPTNNNSFDHFYLTSYFPAFGAYYYEGITGCIWSPTTGP